MRINEKMTPEQLMARLAKKGGPRSQGCQRVRTDQAGLAHPKTVRIKGQAITRAAMPESTLQSFADMELKRRGLFVIRIPDALNQAIMRNPDIPVHIKKLYSDTVKALPDCFVFIAGLGKYCFALPLEIKTEIGKLTRTQKIMAKELNYQVPRSIEAIQAQLDDFEETAGKLINLFQGGP